ncbi:hypothetical protein J7E88_06195 [Streptomyces sp. ISL-10]|uniref:hypothetical protein n=1 Tax=Streptomyces sp. ISL-10 TaxID=2819172 RepID=UPI001BE79441|nr:hypothetical protein [Streptomyces sp. ISL-10]MBT2364923.1 hypothetical protein [Streptomyces sp. ISL-10]
MGHSHAHRPQVSRRDSLRRSAIVGAAGRPPRVVCGSGAGRRTAPKPRLADPRELRQWRGVRDAVTPAYGFITGPRGREKFTFTAFGDQGAELATTAQQPIEPSMNTKPAQSFNPAFHVVVGDLAYANGDQKLWDEWFDMISPMATSTPWMPCISNHATESQLDVLVSGDSWGEWSYDPYRTRFP